MLAFQNQNITTPFKARYKKYPNYKMMYKMRLDIEKENLKIYLQ